MVILQCPTCDFATADVEAVGAAAILQIHGQEHQAQPANSGTRLARPRIKLNSSNEEWNAFTRRWREYKRGSPISDAAASGQLLECAEDTLYDLILRAHPQFTSMPIDGAIAVMKSLAIIPVALGVLRSELLSMMQDPDETFRTFAARVQGKAEICEFKTRYRGRGTCGADNCGAAYAYEGETYYTDEMIRDVLLQGIADVDIRREALSVLGIQQYPLNDIVAFVETRETARNANPATGVSAMSAYRRQGNQQPNQTPKASNRSKSPSAADKAKSGVCPGCNKKYQLFTKRSRGGWNAKPSWVQSEKGLM